MVLLPLLTQTTTDADSWWRLLVTNLGVPGAMCMVLVFALYKGWLRLGRESLDQDEQHKSVVLQRDAAYVAMKAEYDARLKEKDALYAALKMESESRLEQMRLEKDKFLGILIRHQDVTERAVSAAARAADKLPPPQTGS